MGLLAKIKKALKPKENKKKKNVKTYTDNPLLKTKKKETSSTKKTAPKDIKGTLPTGKDRLDEVVKKKTTEKKTTTKTTTNKTTDKKTLPKGPIKGTIPTGKDRIRETLKKKAEEKNPFKPEYSLGTAKNLFEGSPEKRAKNLGVDYQGKGSNTYNGNRSKIEEATKTKPNTKGDSPYQKYQANTVYNYYEEAKKAYDRGDIARGNLYVRKAQEHEEKYQTSKNAPKADPLTGNEALLLQTLSRSGSPEFTQKGLTSAQQEYANGDKTAEYGNIGGKLASNYKHDIDTAPFAQGVINGLGWVPVSRVVKNSSGVDDLNLEGDKTGFYNAGKMAGMFAQALGTGGVIKAASNLGRGARGLINAGVDSVQNIVDAVDTADSQREKGLEIPDYINVSDVAEAKNGATVKRGTEPGKKAEDAKMIPVSIDRWNNDLIAQAWNRAEELGQDPIFGTDKNGRLHYSFTKEGLASILEYYNTFKNPTYSLESTGREYVDSDVLRIGRNMAINTGLSFAGGMIGKGGKQTLKNTEKVAPKTAEEVAESVAPKVDIEPKVKPKTEVKTKPKVKTATDETVIKNEGKTLPKAETKNTEYKIKQSEFTKNVNKAKEGDTVYKFKDGSEIKLESKVYNGKDGYDNFYTVVKNDGTKVENVLEEDLSNTLKADSAMQTLKPKAELPKSKEIKEVNNITDAINSKGFRNKLDNATEGTVLAKTKEGREIKYAGLDENGNDLFTVVRNGKTEAEEISLQELKKLKNLKLTSTTLPTKSVTTEKVKPVESPKPVESLKPETKVNKTEVVEKESASKVGNFEVTAAKKGKDSLNAVADGTAEVMEATSKVKHAYRTAKQLLISGQEPLERMAKELKNTKVLDRVQAVRNANESVAYAFHKGIVSLKRGGIVKNKGLKHAFVVDGKKVKGKELKDYTTYAAHLHNIDRSKQFVYTYTKSNGAEVRVQATDWADAVAKFKNDKKIDITKLEDTGNADFIKFRDNAYDGGVGKWQNLTVESKAVYRQVPAEKSKEIVEKMLKENPRLAKITEQVNEWWNEFSRVHLVESGFMTESQYRAMRKMYPNYVPTYRPNKKGLGASSRGTSASFPLREATGGYSEVLPIEDQFATEINRMIRLSRKNEMLGSFIQELKDNPKATMLYGEYKGADKAAIKYPDVFLDEFDQTAIEQIKGDKFLISAYINGEKVTASVNKEVAEAFRLLDDAYGWKGASTLARIGKSITNPLKTGITGINPLFGIANIARDLPTALIQSDYPVTKTIQGMGKAIAGMAGSKLGKGNKYSEMYNLYKALGGKSAGYFNQGKGFEMAITNGSASHNLFDGIKSMLSIIGETGETVPRLAEFINTIETVGTSADGLTKALRNAAEVTVNFSRSAPLTKSLDAWVLYLNAAVQGLDKFARTAKAHPFRTTVRGSVLISAPFAFLTAHNWDNPHYQDLSDRTKANYFCVPNLRGEMDSEGNPMTFIKIPLNREYGTIFGTTLNLVFAQFKDGDLKSAAEQLKESGKTNFLPQNPVTDNVFAPILINLPSNKDFAGRAIVPANLEDVEPRLQYDANTSEAAMAISSLANNISDKITGKFPSFESKMLEALKSPKKVDYLIDSYGGYLGTLVQSLGNSEMKQIGTYIVDTFGGQFDERFLTDARYSSKPITDFYNAKTEADIAYNSAKLEEDDKLSYYKAVDKIYTDASKQLSDLSKAEKQLLAYDELNNSEKKSAVTAALSLIGDGVLSAEKLKDYNSKKTKLTDEEIKKIIGSMRTTKNNIAKVTKLDAAKFEKDYKANPNFAVLSKEVQAKYKKSYGSKEDFAKVYSIITTKDKDGKDVNGTLAKTAIALKNGLNTDAAYTLSGSESKKENYAEQVEWANYVAESGINITQTSKLKGKADTDGNGYIGKEEAMAYINKNFPMATRKEKAAKFYILCNTSSRKHNPYL